MQKPTSYGFTPFFQSNLTHNEGSTKLMRKGQMVPSFPCWNIQTYSLTPPLVLSLLCVYYIHMLLRNVCVVSNNMESDEWKMCSWFLCDIVYFLKKKNTYFSEVLVLSERNLTFYNVLTWQGSSFCYRPCLSLQAFALHYIK